jgi:hypothetical protein
MTNRKREAEERDSRQAILRAVERERPLFVTDDDSIAHEEAAVGTGGELGVVGDEDEGGALLAVHGEEEVEDVLAVGGVEVAGGFVGHEDGRGEHEGAGEGDALLFAAGELDGVVVASFGEADAIEEFAGALGGLAGGAAEFGGEQDVFFGGEGGDELVALENEPELAAAQAGEAVFRQADDLFAVEEDAAGGGVIESGEEAEEGAFAAAGGAHDGDELAGRDVEIEAAEDIDPVGGGGDGLGESTHPDGRGGRGT